MFSPTVQLRSGGYIVLNQTEALVSIDVNSGRSTREHHIEDTALKTNCEAAEEVARQLRLRDLAGLIVIDFIDMDEKRNNRTVERRLKDALRNDRARIQVGRISHFGLLEMSRQRIRTSVLESSTEKCPHCGGTGHVRSVSSVALQLLRSIEEMLLKGPTHNLIVRTRPDIALYVLNHKRAHLRGLEERFRVTLTVNADEEVGGQIGFTIDRGEQVMTIEQAKAVLAQQADLAAPALHRRGRAGSSKRLRGRDRSRDRIRSQCRRTRRGRHVDEVHEALDAEGFVPLARRRRTRKRRGRAKAVAGAADAAAGAAVAGAAKAARVGHSAAPLRAGITRRAGEFAADQGGAQQPGDQPAYARPRAANRCPKACCRRSSFGEGRALRAAIATATDAHGAGAGVAADAATGAIAKALRAVPASLRSRPTDHEAQPDARRFLGQFRTRPGNPLAAGLQRTSGLVAAARGAGTRAGPSRPMRSRDTRPRRNPWPQALPRSRSPNRQRRRAAARRCASPRRCSAAATPVVTPMPAPLPVHRPRP